jgi:hypothetical protein
VTANALAWTITATLWAGPLALAGIWVLNRVFAWYHSHGRTVAREPKELPSPATAARPWDLSLRLVRDLVDRRGAAPEPGEHHEGATEDFGAELRALADLPPAPELVTDVETERRWAEIWHGYERDLYVQIDEVFAPLLSALTEPLDAKTCMELDAVLAAA